MSHIRSVPSIAAGNAASHAIGLGQMNLHGYLAREGIAYGSPEALDFTNLYFLHHYLACRAYFNAAGPRTRQNLRRICAVALCQRRLFYAVFYRTTGNRKTAKVRTLFARSGITLPTREMWLKLRDDVMRYGIYNQNLQAVPPTGSISYINHATSSIHPIVAKIEIRKEGKTGRVYYPGAVYDQ
ncbi:ribonucleoside-diphosphate reductase 2 subunit alpha [Salmonella enterica subsp. enterica]|uniref:Ribonucleoside-diphosphate reductase 2 subunit alpha n=1 Tax=Salmonella enterica I TaxID=59201 RepID=A0A379WN43_SALET|nr:ribonucleoside-diphosphate reductase 2 subunit alpha [Salmonella enterica subsp. enterica]